MLKCRVFIPQLICIQLSRVSYHGAAKEYLKRFEVKTILESIVAGECKVNFPDNEITWMIRK